MTPQLQQAIRLLQLSTLDLQQEIQEALDSNPLLEVEESSEDSPTTEDKSGNEDKEPTVEVAETDVKDSSELIEKSEISSELEIDTTWDDVYSANTGSTGLALDDDAPVYQGETTQSLHDYLTWQLDLTPFSETDRSKTIKNNQPKTTKPATQQIKKKHTNITKHTHKTHQQNTPTKHTTHQKNPTHHTEQQP